MSALTGGTCASPVPLRVASGILLVLALSTHTKEVTGGNPTSAPVAIGWQTDEGLIPPHCFVTEWMSGDNFEEFAQQYSIEHIEDFKRNPGDYLGKDIPTLDPLIPAWGDTPIILAAPVDLCFKGLATGGQISKQTEINISVHDNWINSNVCWSETTCIQYAYNLLLRVPTIKCEEFAPYINGECKDAFLMEVGDYSGGSLGWDLQYNIYGLFELEEGQRWIVPLKRFSKESQAIRFVRDKRGMY